MGNWSPALPDLIPTPQRQSLFNYKVSFYIYTHTNIHKLYFCYLVSHLVLLHHTHLLQCGLLWQDPRSLANPTTPPMAHFAKGARMR